MMPTLLNNRYRVLQKLGAGGFGNTFLAEDTYLPSGRRCVIKQLKPVTHDPQAYQEAQDRFQREGAVLEELGEGHNQIPRLYAYFSEAGQFYLVQEWIEGQTLTQKLEQEGKLDEKAVTEILISLLPVVDYIHSYHIIHRDIKPDNVIMRQRDGLPVLIDFGAVKEAVKTVVNPQASSVQSMVIGTPGFMPPEQAAGRPTYTSDLYSLGLTAIFLLTGKLPQQLETDAQTGEFLWRQEVPNLHSNLATVIERAIRFHSSDRFASAKQMLDTLRAGSSLSEMDTVAVSPGLPQGNQPTPPNNNPTSAGTVAVGQTPARQGNGNKSLMIGLGIAAGLLLAAVAVGLGLRQPSEPISEQSTTEQTSPEDSTTPSPSPVTKSPEVSTTSPPASPTPPTSQTPPTPPASPAPPASPTTPTSSQSPVTKPSPKPVESTSPEPENKDKSPSQSQKIPAFPPGTQRKAVEFALGEPTKTSSGLWNTRAVLYEEYIPNQVSLGYLFDPSSGRLRQTEASFYQSVGLEKMSESLNKMLSNNASDEIKQGLASVYQRQAKRYQFVSGRGNSLKGVIERNERDRIYIGVWEADLH